MKLEKAKNMDTALPPLLVILILFGNVIGTDTLRVFGVVPNLYRVGIPVLTLCYLCRRLSGKRRNTLEKLNKNLVFFAAMMAFWILYGTVGVFLSSYSVLKEGLQELMSLLLGLMSIYCIYECCHDEDTIHSFLKWIRISCMLLVIWSLFESFTGIHLPYSSLYGTTDTADLGVWAGLYQPKAYYASAIFYNINDFASMLAIFTPVFFLDTEDKRGVRIVNGVFMVAIIYLLAVDDATIAFFSVLMGLVCYLLLRKGQRVRTAVVFAGSVGMNFWGNRVVMKGLGWVKGLLWKLPGTATPPTVEPEQGVGAPSSLIAALNNQFTNANAGYGSLWHRYNITVHSLQTTLETYGLGLGPGSFSNYFRQNPAETSLTDPHGWWVEILSQYGVWVFLAYTVSIVRLYILMIRLYLRTHLRVIAVVLSMCTAFVLACIGPSSFLGYAYQWILPALCIAILHVHSKDLEKGAEKGRKAQHE
jgi:teichuronic acid biosynthesis protein TuaE